MPQRAVYQCSEEGAAVCSGDVSMQKAADDERANTATPSPQALRHRQQCSRRSSRARRAKTGGQQRSATTRKFSETCLSTRADTLRYHPTHLCAAPPRPAHAHDLAPTSDPRNTRPQHPSPLEPLVVDAPTRRILVSDAIGGRSTSTKGVRTVETRRVRREAGRRGVRTILDDVLLAPRRRLHRRSSRQPLPSRLRPGRRHHDLQTRLDASCAPPRDCGGALRRPSYAQRPGGRCRPSPSHCRPRHPLRPPRLPEAPWPAFLRRAVSAGGRMRAVLRRRGTSAGRLKLH